MLKEVMGWIKRDKYTVNNLDATVVAESPKLAPYMGKIKDNLARILEGPPTQINIKAKTTEGMGFSGRQEGIAAYAVVSLVRQRMEE